jgi:hypothetical protein
MDTNLLVKLFERLKTNRSTWEAHWQEVADYFLPTKAMITKTRLPGQKLPIDKYDSTPADSLQVFAAGLHSYLTNPASRWFNLGVRERELRDIKEVKDFFGGCQEEMFHAFNNSNLNQQIHEVYIDFGGFGTPCIYEEEDLEDDIRFYTRPISEIYIMENEKERVDFVFRFCSYTARQAYAKWGDNAGEKVKEAILAGKWDENFDFLHIVMPRHERIAGKEDSKNKPYASLYIEISAKRQVSESGYDTFPFFVPRNIKLSGEAWGYSQCMIALPDAKTLNAMTKTILKGAQKQVDPPIVVPDDGYILPFKITAGAVNFKNTQATDSKVDILNFQGNLPIGLEMQDSIRKQIRRVLFVDLFLFFATLEKNPNMTATEVRERINEKMLILGPILGRLMNELLDPMIHRTFDILARNGKLPPLPDILIGKNYTVEYISPLAKAQRLSDIQSLNDFLMSLISLAKLSPDIVDILNSDKAGRNLGNKYNVDSEILRGDDEIKEIRQIRQQQQQATQEAMLLQQGGAGLKSVAEAAKVGKEVGIGAGTQ